MSTQMTSGENRAPKAPAHVPPELIWDRDIDQFAGEMADPFLSAARLHEGPDIIWATGATRAMPGWVPTRFKLMQEIFLDHGRFSSRENVDACDLLGVTWRLNPLEIDPPAHAAYRQVLMPWFQPKAILKIEPVIESICRTLIGKFEKQNSCEFISDFASLFPSHVFLTLMGMPLERLDQFLAWEHDFMRGKDMPTRVGAARSIMHYLEEYVAERRNVPGDDLVGAIVNARIDGRLLDDGEVMGMCMVLYFGGLDTVLSSLGWYMRHLVRDLPLQERLRANPDQVTNAVDELLRAYGVTGTKRTVTETCEFHGVQMKAGDWVLLPTYLAGRDPREYANPHAIDIDRKGRHLTLATGVHHCLGAHLARREIKIVLEEFLSRFANIRVPDGETDSWHTVGVWGVDRLPLTWDRV